MTEAVTRIIRSAEVIAVGGSALTRCADAMADLTSLGRHLASRIFLRDRDVDAGAAGGGPSCVNSGFGRMALDQEFHP